MSITIQLSPELQKRLQQRADKAGLKIDRFINQILEEKTELKDKSVDLAKKQEAVLLRKINTGFNAEFWEKYAVLVQKRNTASLSDAEYKNLLLVSNQIEEANARRIENLIKLAALKKMDLDVLMAKLGIAPANHA